MPSALVPDFDISEFGFGFLNSFDKPFLLRTPLGRLAFEGNAGLCGGMTFGSLDYYSASRTAPDELYQYLCDRQMDSLDLPGGVVKYLSWQTTSDTRTMMFGTRVFDGISYSTLTNEWPKIQNLLDSGHLAPLGLIKTDASSPEPSGARLRA